MSVLRLEFAYSTSIARLSRGTPMLIVWLRSRHLRRVPTLAATIIAASAMTVPILNQNAIREAGRVKRSWGCCCTGRGT